jgi:PKD repeat protein
VKEDTALEFKGTGTDTVSDMADLNFTWDFGDGTTAFGKNVTYTYTKPKAYTATLTVKDNEGATGIATVQITVTNVKPVAKASASLTSVKTKEVITFSSVGSNDTASDLAGLKYLWTFGDGSSSTLKNPTHSYTTGGSKPVKLTVTDEHGEVASASLTITVQGTGGGGGDGDDGTNMTLVAAAIGGIVAAVLIVLALLFLRKKGDTTPKPKKVKVEEDEEEAEAAPSKPTKTVKKAKVEKDEEEKPSKEKPKEKEDEKDEDEEGDDEDISDDEPAPTPKDASKKTEAPKATKDEKK